MGGKHGAEICKLVGLYLLNRINGKLNGLYISIYRDNGLMAQNKNIRGPEITKIKKAMHEYKKGNKDKHRNKEPGI